MKKIIFLFSLLSIVSNFHTSQYCDIKGSVNNPGVYEIKEDYTIHNIIELAGGLTKDAYTDNINLSKKVQDEMVIYISNKKEIKKLKSLNNCICKPIYEYKNCEDKKEESISTTTTQPIKVNTTTSITTKKKEQTTITTPTNIIEPTTITTTNKIEPTTIISTTNMKEIKININTCNIEDLIKVDGLGETKAKKIIDYRTKNGLFKSIDDLLNIDGIGNKTLEKIKDFIEI